MISNFRILIKLTRSDEKGVNIAPIRPAVEHNPIIELRTLVGNISIVNTYIIPKALVIKHFADSAKNSVNDT